METNEEKCASIDDKVQLILARLDAIEYRQQFILEQHRHQTSRRIALQKRLASVIKQAAAKRSGPDRVEAMSDRYPGVHFARYDGQRVCSAANKAWSVLTESEIHVSEGMWLAKVCIKHANGGDCAENWEDVAKVRVMVELDEVEAALHRCPLIEWCRVYGRPSSASGHAVFCTVVPIEGQRVSEPLLRAYAEALVPAALVPQRFFLLDAMPVGVSRSALAGVHGAVDWVGHATARRLVQYDCFVESEPGRTSVD
jgi:AMP-binding enzyme C-terminal domain